MEDAAIAALIGILVTTTFGLSAEGLTEGARETARIAVFVSAHPLWLPSWAAVLLGCFKVYRLFLGFKRASAECDDSTF